MIKKIENVNLLFFFLLYKKKINDLELCNSCCNPLLFLFYNVMPLQYNFYLFIYVICLFIYFINPIHIPMYTII